MSDSADRTAAIREARARAIRFLLDSQHDDGSWRGRYDGPQFLLPMYVVAMNLISREIPDSRRKEMLRYLRRQVRDDGGWGLHVEDARSRVFPTVLCYVAARLLGLESDDPLARGARRWMDENGDATELAPWGKMLLSYLDLCDYRGVFPVPPELWLLPGWAPFHPSRLWCHSRMVHLPMSYLYGQRFSGPCTESREAIRTEIYRVPYAEIDWRKTSLTVAESDSCRPVSKWLLLAEKALRVFEKIHIRRWRARALRFVADQVRREDEATDYICLAPISGLLNLLVRHHEEPEGDAVRRHLERIEDYFCRDESGLRLNGYRNSRVWDTAFALQALNASGLTEPLIGNGLAKARRFLETQQILADPPDRERSFRGPARGGFPFCSGPHSWAVTDSTAESLSALLGQSRSVDSPVERERVVMAVDWLLAVQNPDGGWGTYERIRGPRWLESFDSSRVFANTMIDYSYPECTSSCFRALLEAKDFLGGPRDARIARAVAKGTDYLLRSQNTDGSWTGSWGICFTYGTWFGVWGLRAAGFPEDAPPLQKARRYLESIQMPDGGWGELAESCRVGASIPSADGQAVMTAWALLALARCGGRERGAARRGIDFLLRRQWVDGSWPDEHISGVFNRTCAIHYDNYIKIFPLWALLEYESPGPSRALL